VAYRAGVDRGHSHRFSGVSPNRRTSNTSWARSATGSVARWSRGETGTGKTALLDEAASLATDLRVLRLVGIESEMELGYAGLHLLLHPFAEDVDTLPPSYAPPP
jgi:hypothetical protein